MRFDQRAGSGKVAGVMHSAHQQGQRVGRQFRVGLVRRHCFQGLLVIAQSNLAVCQTVGDVHVGVPGEQRCEHGLRFSPIALRYQNMAAAICKEGIGRIPFASGSSMLRRTRNVAHGKALVDCHRQQVGIARVHLEVGLGACELLVQVLLC